MVRGVLVTGATGGQLVPRLAGYNDLAVRAFVRSAKKAAPLETSGAELALGLKCVTFTASPAPPSSTPPAQA